MITTVSEKTERNINFIIDTGFPVTIMPCNQNLLTQRHPTTETKLPRCKQERNQIPGEIWVNSENNNSSMKLPVLFTERNDITPPLGVSLF